MAKADKPPRPKAKRNGHLAIPLPFDDALRAALEVPPESIPPAPTRARPKTRKKPAKKT